MTFTKQQNGTALEIAVKGRLDTMTAPKLEEELNRCLTGITELTVNLAELKYISSAGLWLLLATYKRMNSQGNLMKVVLANDLIQEVFEVTGFSDLLDAE